MAQVLDFTLRASSVDLTHEAAVGQTAGYEGALGMSGPTK